MTTAMIIYVLDYISATVIQYNISEDYYQNHIIKTYGNKHGAIEQWLVDEKGHDMDACYYMISDNDEVQIENL